MEISLIAFIGFAVCLLVGFFVLELVLEMYEMIRDRIRQKALKKTKAKKRRRIGRRSVHSASWGD